MYCRFWMTKRVKSNGNIQIMNKPSVAQMLQVNCPLIITIITAVTFRPQQVGWALFTHLWVLVDGEFFSLLECIDGAPRTTEQGGVISWWGLPVWDSGALARTFLEPGTGFPMLERFPRLSFVSSLSFFPRSFLLKCVAAVPAAAGLSSWTSNILSMSLSVCGCVCMRMCECVSVCVFVWEEVFVKQ